MKYFLLVISFSLLAALPVCSQDVDKLPVITVTGTAEMQVAPDEATLTLVVTKTDKELSVAKLANDEAVRKVLDVARRFSIAPQNVKTDFITVEMKYDYVRDPSARVYDANGSELAKKLFRGYDVSKAVVIKLTNISRFEEFFSAILITGITEVSSVTFSTSTLRENKDKARAMAMKAAKEKSTDLAAAVGQTIGKAIKITEGLSFTPYSNYQSNSLSNVSSTGGSFSESSTTFAPGSITITAQVTVSFLLN